MTLTVLSVEYSKHTTVYCVYPTKIEMCTVGRLRAIKIRVSDDVHGCRCSCHQVLVVRLYMIVWAGVLRARTIRPLF